MSTRATITAKMNDKEDKMNHVWVSFYKHHDGYIKGGLGEALMNFVTYNDPKKESFTKSSFLQFIDELEPKMVGMEKVERVMDGQWLGSYKLHGDTEYHYTFDKLHGKTFLFVQERDYTDSAQNGTDRTETGHWTDFAEKTLIGVSGGPFFDHILDKL